MTLSVVCIAFVHLPVNDYKPPTFCLGYRGRAKRGNVLFMYFVYSKVLHLTSSHDNAYGDINSVFLRKDVSKRIFLQPGLTSYIISRYFLW